MRNRTHPSFCSQAALLFAMFLLGNATICAQISGNTDINSAQKTGDDNECAVSINPVNKNQVFAFCNTGGPGLFATRSTDGGATWTFPDPADKTIADGDAGQGPAACCDPTSAWDSFGNLFITYIDSGIGNIVTILSTDGGATFTNLASFAGSVDQPTVVAANTSAAGAPVAVWVVWNQSGQMVARGAAVTGLGVVGAFGALQTIPGTSSCSFGDIAIAPSGAVVQGCQTPVGGQGPATIVVNTDTDGLGPGNFGAAVNATTTNVGGFDFIPAQNARSVDPETGLAFDNNPASPHFGRLYLVYTDETVNENNDTDIMLRFSDDNGATWSAPIRVNDDPPAPIRSQFLPKMAVDDNSGSLSICWHDARNSPTNRGVQIFCTTASTAGATPTFLPNVLISDGTSTSNGAGVEFGDYAGLDYFMGVVLPVWADTSNSTGNNPNGTGNFDAYVDRVTAALTGKIQVPGNVAFGSVCAGPANRTTLNVCNTGGGSLSVTGITSSNAQFAVTTPSGGFPIVIAPGSCFPFEVTFAPAAPGPQTANLTIASDDPTTPSLAVTATARGETGSLGLSPNVLLSPTVIHNLGSCKSPRPFVISNTGACNLTITNVAIGGANAADFSLSGLPAFPVILQPGHAVGSGDLNVDFAPNAFARERTGNITVTFVNDPVTGTTSTQTRELCGEGVRTGARVLVTQGGVPVPQVHEIELKRYWGGWFGFSREVDEVHNAPLQTITATPGTACGTFQFHREYGGVSNQKQLRPGIYQLEVEVKIGGNKVEKKVWFNLDTCGFNGTIVVDF